MKESGGRGHTADHTAAPHRRHSSLSRGSVYFESVAQVPRAARLRRRRGIEGSKRPLKSLREERDSEFVSGICRIAACNASTNELEAPRRGRSRRRSRSFRWGEQRQRRWRQWRRQLSAAAALARQAEGKEPRGGRPPGWESHGPGGGEMHVVPVPQEEGAGRRHWRQV